MVKCDLLDTSRLAYTKLIILEVRCLLYFLFMGYIYTCGGFLLTKVYRDINKFHFKFIRLNNFNRQHLLVLLEVN